MSLQLHPFVVDRELPGWKYNGIRRIARSFHELVEAGKGKVNIDNAGFNALVAEMYRDQLRLTRLLLTLAVELEAITGVRRTIELRVHPRLAHPLGSRIRGPVPTGKVFAIRPKALQPHKHDPKNHGRPWYDNWHFFSLAPAGITYLTSIPNAEVVALIGQSED